MGNTKHRIDLTGRVYGRWTVLHLDAEKNSDKGAYWKVRCECGIEKSVKSGDLRNGKSRSCGCLAKELAKERVVKPYGTASMNKLYADYKRGALKRGHSFELTIEEFKEITSQACAYCGIEPKQIRVSMSNPDVNGHYIHNGIDRVDNKKGYTVDNCVPCCSMCNNAKHHHTQEEFLSWVERVYKHSF